MTAVDWNAPREKDGVKYNVIRSGQPRPYADSYRTIEVYLKEGLTKQEASDIVRELDIGFDDSNGKEWYQPKLSYFREKSPGIWEFEMVSAYTG